MAIKLKKLLINNPVLKFVSLFILFISLSILFEVCFNLMFNFLGFSTSAYMSKYYLFGPISEYSRVDLLEIQKLIAFNLSLFSLIFLIIYFFNRKANVKFINSLIRLTNFIPIEVLLTSIVFVFLTRYSVWKQTPEFYDTDLIIADTIILCIIYFSCISIYSSRNKISSRFICINLFQKFISKNNKNSLLKRISTIFVIAIIVQFIFIFISMYNFGSWPIYGLTRSIYLSSVSAILYSYIYKKIEEKIDYIVYIKNSIKNIENGDLEYKLNIIGNDELSSISTSINNISDGLNKSLENQLKNEKMKTELITNVSHDLKTPLTSIVSYIDILKNNELDNQTTKNYLNILDKKAYRLKNLVEDIFEASKISSGDIELYFEKTDIKELLIQSIVELDDKIESSNLDFIVNTPDNPIFTNIDGKRMFRVFDNLISNIVKYSLSNTRVYIDMYTDCGNVLITMKNISNHKLNITPDELMERFVRGDVSRNTSGSGLGLSIAKNLVNIQGGKLELDIDGDLFKVKLKFNVIQNLNESTI
ncbi:HAMP domain-containing sensor histidine kinase [Paraclostridium sordellii]|uniref:histidine kinase n=2 Tax=Paraclostridium sordellii TaxID=1505 RepID=A0A9P1L2N0_PARSO|nr:sensor histidine kinase [Paeniclostridium sordellii]CEO32205.1 two-component sensor histidine kinase [[Clostridium] sordellii] [Paeniclostridium sordellii]